jgi:hypothetical protein
MTYQNYSYYKLPITTNPLEYGKLIKKIDNIYIIQLTLTNILIINEYKNYNFISLFRDGKLIFEFEDHRIDNSTFYRIIKDNKFIFSNGKLVRTEIIGLIKPNIIYEKNIIYSNSIILKKNSFIQNSLVNGNLSSILKRGFSTSAINSVKHPGNIVKLRRGLKNV